MAVTKILLCVTLIVALVGVWAQAETEDLNGQKFEFQAEVTRMMDILIHALYSKRDVFLRELISNASDALDKIRYMLVKDQKNIDEVPLLIRIKADKEKNTLTISDTGVGMTKSDLVNNLGTIARSGTKQFMEQLENSKDLNLIGQFGVGFYSAFVVADTITVYTKNDADRQWVWRSNAASFEIAEDNSEDKIDTRGTTIVLNIKEDAKEFLEESKIKELVAQYSEFIDYPIELWVSKSVEKEVPIEEEVEAEAETESAESDEETATEDTTTEKPTTKKVTETIHEWERLNVNKPLWQRPKDEISDDEYKQFYKTLSKEYEDPLDWVHFTAEGEHEFKSILYIPPRAQNNFFEKTGKTTSVRLYVRRVFITDQFDDLLPRYLAFIWGIVDSDDLPLNVSREMLQEHKTLRMIKKKITRKAIELIKAIADKEDQTDYEKFWEAYGKNVKLGVIEDQSNRDKLAKLCRFYSSKSGDKMVSLEQYVARMQEDQKGIYYIAAETKEAAEKSPFLERLLKRDLEVLYLVDPIDEYAIQNIPEFEEHKIYSVSKEGLKLGEETEEEKEKEKQIKEEMQGLIDFLKTTLSDKVEKVIISSRLADSPAVLVTGMYGWSANMERIVRAQALGDANRASFMASKKTMEINPDHPIVQELNKKYQSDEESAKELSQLMYETALLTSGFSLEDTAGFASRMYRIMSSKLGNQDTVKAGSQAQHDEL
eukprot:TRINITY_DN2321_c0_g1_i1.p1 TRINITY_DN2321_c0_g1~~TRINITY_DN2321_c0_g1_i1.p1  ORF type:complete len:736 (-),score=200.27 TRINITY_DN2321_c0_g1_i1:58-2199(-)